MVFRFQWTKSFWSQSQKLLDVGAGAGAKTLDTWSQNRSLTFAFRLHSLGKKYCKQPTDYFNSLDDKAALQPAEEHFRDMLLEERQSNVAFAHCLAALKAEKTLKPFCKRK